MWTDMGLEQAMLMFADISWCQAISLTILNVHLSWKLHMMTSSNGNIFRVTGHLCREFTGPGEFPAQRQVTRSFDVFFDLCLNKRLSKQSWGWWSETLSCPLWRHCNASKVSTNQCVLCRNETFVRRYKCVTQIPKTLGLTATRHRAGARVWDRCLIDVFAI